VNADGSWPPRSHSQRCSQGRCCGCNLRQFAKRRKGSLNPIGLHSKIVWIPRQSKIRNKDARRGKTPGWRDQSLESHREDRCEDGKREARSNLESKYDETRRNSSPRRDGPRAAASEERQEALDSQLVRGPPSDQR